MDITRYGYRAVFARERIRSIDIRTFTRGSITDSTDYAERYSRYGTPSDLVTRNDYGDTDIVDAVTYNGFICSRVVM